MITVSLQRFRSGDDGTFGVLRGNGLCLYTGELPWRNNNRGISRIPAGKYEVMWDYSNKFKKKTYRLRRVRGRYGIRIHAANFFGDRSMGFKSEVRGCIAVGKRYSTHHGQRALFCSRSAVKKLEKHMERKNFILKVSNAYSR